MIRSFAGHRGKVTGGNRCAGRKAYNHVDTICLIGGEMLAARVTDLPFMGGRLAVVILGGLVAGRPGPLLVEGKCGSTALADKILRLKDDIALFFFWGLGLLDFWFWNVPVLVKRGLRFVVRPVVHSRRQVDLLDRPDVVLIFLYFCKRAW